VRSLRLLDMGAELVRRGVPGEVALDELERLRDDARRVARRVTALFRTYLLPNLVRGEPNEWLPRIAGFVGRFRPQVRAALAAALMQAIDDEVREFRSGFGGGFTPPGDAEHERGGAR
jgi:AcrR family transcriptional regulator